MAKHLTYVTDQAAADAGRGEQLAVLRVWPKSHSLVTMAAGIAGVPKTHMLHLMITEYLKANGQLDTLQQLLNLQTEGTNNAQE